MSIKSIILAASLVVGLASQASADLLTNGGFESGDFTGWTVAGDPVDIAQNDGVDVLAPNSGNFAAYFGSIGITTLSQSIGAVASGQTYTVSFWLQFELDVLGNATPNSFTASFGGVTLLKIVDSPDTPYTFYTFDVTGAQDGNLVFALSDQPAFIDLDDVQVTARSVAVPGPIVGAGPASFALLAPFIGWLARRRKRSPV